MTDVSWSVQNCPDFKLGVGILEAPFVLDSLERGSPAGRGLYPTTPKILVAVVTELAGFSETGRVRFHFYGCLLIS